MHCTDQKERKVVITFEELRSDLRLHDTKDMSDVLSLLNLDKRIFNGSLYDHVI